MSSVRKLVLVVFGGLRIEVVNLYSQNPAEEEIILLDLGPTRVLPAFSGQESYMHFFYFGSEPPHI
jgi:hypothetical protein